MTPGARNARPWISRARPSRLVAGENGSRRADTVARLFKSGGRGGGIDPERAQKVIDDYAALLRRVDGTHFHDVATLPHSKAEIARALLRALHETSDPVLRLALGGSLLCLARFQQGVGPEPVDPANGEDERTEALKAMAAEEVADYRRLIRKRARL